MKVTELMPLGVEAEIMEAFASPPREAAGRAEPDWSIMEGTGKAGRQPGCASSRHRGTVKRRQQPRARACGDGEREQAAVGGRARGKHRSPEWARDRGAAGSAPPPPGYY